MCALDTREDHMVLMVVEVAVVVPAEAAVVVRLELLDV